MEDNWNMNFLFELKEKGTEELIKVLINERFLVPVMFFESCEGKLKEVKYKKNVDKQAFICYKLNCSKFNKYIYQ